MMIESESVKRGHNNADTFSWEATLSKLGCLSSEKVFYSNNKLYAPF